MENQPNEDKKKKFIESADDLARLIDERTDELLCILWGEKIER